MNGLTDNYRPDAFFDEAFTEDGAARPSYSAVLGALDRLGASELARRNELRDLLQRSRGVTFTLRSEEGDLERTFPLDLVPRIIDAEEWRVVEAGLIQRVKALNAFLVDIYGDQACLHDKLIPRRLLYSLPGFERAAHGVRCGLDVHIHVAGLDLVRGDEGRWYVLEDNVRTPSGVSYVMENREVMAQALPEFFEGMALAPVDHYPQMLLRALQATAPLEAGPRPKVVVLTPGVYNSAYFEHALLARQMGVDLVEGSDLLSSGGQVFVRTTQGPRKVDVIYRRIDDDYSDPLVFRPESVVGCAGLLNAARAGHVTLANAVGNGAADDKSVYPYVPEMIRYYLGETPILENVRTWLCGQAEDRATVLDRLDQVVIKPTDGSGGYGVVIGPRASAETLDKVAAAIRENPDHYIAQDLVKLSTHPTMIDGKLSPRHVDLRPFIVQGERVEVLPGGLTRVALPEGSFVVNSSQGGGSKDTWVLQDTMPQTTTTTSLGASRESQPVPRRALTFGPERDASRSQQQQQQQQGPALRGERVGSPC